MAQTIKIKRSTGSAAPSTLAQGELAYSKGSDTLYVGDPAAANTPIAVGGAIKNNAGSPVLATGVTAAEIRTLIDVDQAGTDNSTNVTLGGTLDYLTISGQTITRNAIDLSTDVTGSLPNTSVSGLGSLATLSTVGANEITDNSVGAAELNVSGNGTSGQALVSDGDGTFSWSTISVTDVDVSVANLQTRLGQISTATNFGTGASADVTFSADVTISGDLTVSGTTTTVNTETINLADNIITLNSNETGTPSENAGMEVERGTSTNTVLRWNETSDRWEFTNDGSTYYNIPISTEYGTGDITAVTAGNGLTGGATSGAATLNVGAGTGISVAADSVSLATAGAGAATYSSGISAITVDAYGRVTSVTGSAGYTTNDGDITSVQISSTDASITGTGTGTAGAISFDLEVGTIDGGTY